MKLWRLTKWILFCHWPAKLSLFLKQMGHSYLKIILKNSSPGIPSKKNDSNFDCGSCNQNISKFSNPPNSQALQGILKILATSHFRWEFPGSGRCQQRPTLVVTWFPAFREKQKNDGVLLSSKKLRWSRSFFLLVDDPPILQNDPQMGWKFSQLQDTLRVSKSFGVPNETSRIKRWSGVTCCVATSWGSATYLHKIPNVEFCVTFIQNEKVEAWEKCWDGPVLT